jgi:hypothetical protein
MNLKRWFVWMCLALMIVLEIFLFQSNREKDELQNQLRTAQEQYHQATNQLAELQDSTTQLRGGELDRLRHINTILTNKVKYVQSVIRPLLAENQSNAENLALARLAINLQKDRIDEMESQSDQIVDVSIAIINQKNCVNNLRLIDDAKQQWAVDNKQPDNAHPTVDDLTPYFPNKVFPACPDGGTYYINAVDEVPTCSIHTHALQNAVPTASPPANPPANPPASPPVPAGQPQ